MIKFQINDITNQYRLQGVKHFISKYGLENNNQKPHIIITYADIKYKNKFIIKILKNTISEQREAKLIFKNILVPLLEKPHNLKNQNGKCIYQFIYENKKYCCIKKDKNIITIGVDLFYEIGLILSGYLIKFGNNDFALPLIDYYEKILFDCILMGSKELSIPLIQKDFWPSGETMAISLSHDVDRINSNIGHYIFYFVKYVIKLNFKKALYQIYLLFLKIRGIEPYWCFDKIINLENKYNVKSTFFLLNETGKSKLFQLKSYILFKGRYKITAKPVLEIIQYLKKNRWEIGLHGSYYSFNNKILLQQEKNILQKIVKIPIKSIRQHYLNLNIPATWYIQKACGFKYDSSLGFTDKIGFRGGTTFPFYFYDRNKRISLLLIPLLLMDNMVENDFNNKINNLFNIVKDVNGILTVNWHQRAFAYKENKKHYEMIIKKGIENKVWFATINEIGEWWEIRDKLLVKSRINRKTLIINLYSTVSTKLTLKLYLPQEMKIKEIINRNLIDYKTDKNLVFIYTKIKKGENICKINYTRRKKI